MSEPQANLSTVPTNDGQRRKKLHFVMQGKGGVGKSFIASLICQTLSKKEVDYDGYDLDPNNQTLAAITGLPVKTWSILRDDVDEDEDEESVIDTARFDELMREITKTDKDVVLDTGASVFIDLNNYLIINGMINLLDAQGIDVYMHCVVIGGGAQQECLVGLDRMVSVYKDHPAKIIIWLNEKEGKIEADKVSFEDGVFYKENKHHVDTIIKVPRQRNPLFEEALKEMNMKSLTFEGAAIDPTIDFIVRARLQKMEKQYVGNLSNFF